MNEHLIAEFKKFGVTDKAAVISLQVYLELTEVKKYWNVSYDFNSELNSIIIRAKKTKSEPLSVFIPISVFEQLSFAKLQEILSNTKESSVFLAIVHPDSTCIYYQISEDLVEPSDTSAKHKKIDLREKLDSDLRKNRKLLEQAALYGLPVTIVNKQENKDKQGDSGTSEKKNGS